VEKNRLGDSTFLNVQQYEQELILKEHPIWFGSKHILGKRNNNNCDNIDIITKIVLEQMDQNLDRLPLDISESIVIHLRLGDVVAGHQLHEKVKRPLSVDYLKILLKKTY
jgi:hypothetical protein